MLVEDEDGLRSLNARGLRSRGYTVVEAANGVEAMEVLDAQDGQIDLVVSDVVMPEMDGPTLLKELRDEGCDDAKLSRIHTPIGLPINSRTPDEIAVSIAAEMISIRNGQNRD